MAAVSVYQFIEIFAVVFTLLFSVVLLLEGVFSAYFGRGRSRTLGFALIAMALLAGGGFYLLGGPLDVVHIDLLEITVKAVLYIVSGVLGALLALVIFLMLIVRT